MKKRLFCYALLLVALVGAVGGALLKDARREESLLRSMSRLTQARQALLETDYFLHRYDRVLLSHVMLPDDAEKFHIYQEQNALTERLGLWERKMADEGDAGADLSAVKDAFGELAFLRFQIMNLMEGGLHEEAILKTEQVFLPASEALSVKLKAVGTSLDARTRGMTGEIAAAEGLDRRIAAGGLILALLLLAALAGDLRSAMILKVSPSAQDAVRPRATALPSRPLAGGRA